MAQQTAVEWLIEQLKIRGYAGEFPPHLLFEQAKQMEKEQIMDAVERGSKWAFNGLKIDPGKMQNNTTTKHSVNNNTHTNDTRATEPDRSMARKP